MKKHVALAVITKFVQDHMAGLPIAQQIPIYEALGELMPTVEERRQATEIAVSLCELAKLQLDFHRQLFNEIQWPGHRHDGPPHDL